jgi:hypothetical protein
VPVVTLAPQVRAERGMGLLDPADDVADPGRDRLARAF